MDRNLLTTRTRLITHGYDNSECPDGIASAMLIKHVLPNIEIVFVVYNSPEHRNLKPGEGDIFCDFTPHPDTVDEFLEARAIVLDHHRSQQDIVERFVERGLGVYADEAKEPGVSGAVLAWLEVWKPLNEREVSHARVMRFARLAGIRDTWQTKHGSWDEACGQAEALRFYGAEYLLKKEAKTMAGVPVPYLGPKEEEVGRLLFDKKIAEAKGLAERAFIWRDYAIMNRNDMTSDVAEQLRLMGSPVKALVSFGYSTDSDDNFQITYSMRSVADDFDVSKIAKAMDGGGHPRAAGFKVVVRNKTLDSNWDVCPVELFRRGIRRSKE
jgi:oligoribonuclease NrnB/cAMP/cGMP phosphodiesterase (DHH superfamily)